MKHRKDDLIGIRKARFASFVLLLICFAAMLVILVLAPEKEQAYIVSAAVIAVLVICWWFIYKRILFEEATFFETFATDVRAVHHRLRMLESAVRQIGDGVVIVAEDSDLVIVNETVKRLFAAYDGDLDGLRYDEYAAGFNAKLEREAIIAAARRGAPPEVVSVDGQYYKIGFVSLVAEKGRERGAVAVISNVTESAKAESMQVDFIANVSHELKTPLASVMGSAETLKAGAAENPEDLEKFLGIILSEAARMNGLVSGLLYLARARHVEAGAKITKSDLPTLVKASMRKLDMAAGEKSLSVNQMFASNLRVNVEMDRDCIESVILNILGNAIKYTKEKGRIDVDIISGQNCVQIVIADNGIGIPDEDLARIFERFYRTDKARSGKSGGVGLGLAISREIIDAHGGTISIDSKHGRGTTVTVSLPVAGPGSAPGIL